MELSVVSRCVKCIRAKPKFNAPLMAPFLKERVQFMRPFVVTGDALQDQTVHLEAMEDLSTQAFLASLRRFTARRGLCSSIFSDNGTNFVGARRELYSHVKAAQPQLAQKNIEWRFNPPLAPYFGGLWEKLSTLLCQIEACLNSQLLTPISSDPSDLEVPTQAHFLIGGPISLPPEVGLTQESMSSLKRWKYVQYLMKLFWRRCSSEYLPQLHIRGKWISNKAPLKSVILPLLRMKTLHLQNGNWEELPHLYSTAAALLCLPIRPRR
ncbi:Integrase catalytic domain-containing protein, partial [Aphis craccivora]